MYNYNYTELAHVRTMYGVLLHAWFNEEEIVLIREVNNTIANILHHIYNPLSLLIVCIYV